MAVLITIDTSNITDEDRELLATILGTETPAPKSDPAPKSNPAPAKKAAPAKRAAAKPKPEPKPEPEEEDEEPDLSDIVADDDEADETPTLDDAIAASVSLARGGDAAKVKAALKKVGALKVSELTEDQIGPFMEAIA